MAEYSPTAKQNDKRPLLVVIVGPTASGKTALSLALAREFGAEIVSADSMQVYKGMDIQTAKPTTEQMSEIPHHLIGVLRQDESFSVTQYQSLATAAIDDILSRGRLPILVGGTGLYISAVVDNTCFGDMVIDPAIRQRLIKAANEQGGQQLLARLSLNDPELAAKLHPNNLGRIIRALEVFEATGKTLSEFQANSRLTPSPYQVLMLGVTFKDRQRLYDRINDRVDEMLRMGLLREIEEMRNAPLSHTAAKAIGCKELSGYFDGTLTLEQAVENLKRQTRRYAKRQLTWFGRDERVNWLYQENGDVIARARELILPYLSGCNLL